MGFVAEADNNYRTALVLSLGQLIDWKQAMLFHQQ